MKVLVALCFVAAVAQAIDVDWSTVKTMDVIPKNIAEVMERDNWLRNVAESRIVGGQEAVLGQFPYQIALLATTAAGTGFCGGSILNEKWILTAAHCVDAATSVTVLLAAQNVKEQNPEQFSVVASKIVVHEGWNPSTITNDIALLELPEALTYSDLVKPTRLPSRSQVSKTFAGENGVVSGWGKDSDSATSVSAVLRWTENPILTNGRCNLQWLGIVSADQICLSGHSGRSSCNGDSGGPLVVEDTDGQTTQVGVVSFGLAFGCAIGWPGVYTRLSSHLDWIEINTNGSVVIRD